MVEYFYFHVEFILWKGFDDQQKHMDLISQAMYNVGSLVILLSVAVKSNLFAFPRTQEHNYSFFTCYKR